MVFTKSDGVAFLGKGWGLAAYRLSAGLVVWGKAYRVKPFAWFNLFSVPCAQNSQGEHSDCIWQELRVIAFSLRIGWKKGGLASLISVLRNESELICALTTTFSFTRSIEGMQKNMAMQPTPTSPSATLSPKRIWRICGFLSRGHVQWPVGKVRQQYSIFTFYGDLGRLLVWLAGSHPDLYSMGSPGLTERNVTSVIDTWLELIKHLNWI